jgi:isopropylmalate/homocitrate/citramalate synthase
MMNLDTGIDIDLLHQSRELASNLTGLQLGGRMPYSGANI